MDINQDTILTLDALLAKADLTNVTAEGAGFEPIPDGYYLTLLEDIKLTETKETHKPMVSAKFSVLSDCLLLDVDAAGNPVLNAIPISKNRKMFVNWVINDESGVNRYVSDMLKFEIVPGEPVLDKAYFLSSATMSDAFDVIKGSVKVYIKQTTTEKEGKTYQNSNIVRNKVAADLGLPVDFF